MEELTDRKVVEDYEIEWMLKKRPLKFDLNQLKIDYGEEESNEIIENFEKCGLKHLLDIGKP